MYSVKTPRGKWKRIKKVYMQKKSTIWYITMLGIILFVTFVIPSGNTLVLFQLVEKHGMVLHSMMKDFDRKVFFVYGGTDTQTREDIRAITENEKMQSSLHLMVRLVQVSI